MFLSSNITGTCAGLDEKWMRWSTQVNHSKTALYKLSCCGVIIKSVWSFLLVCLFTSVPSLIVHIYISSACVLLPLLVSLSCSLLCFPVSCQLFWCYLFIYFLNDLLDYLGAVSAFINFFLTTIITHASLVSYIGPWTIFDTCCCMAVFKIPAVNRSISNGVRPKPG